MEFLNWRMSFDLCHAHITAIKIGGIPKFRVNKRARISAPHLFLMSKQINYRIDLSVMAK